MTDLEAQPRPSEVSCPECGAAPTDESVRDHKLSDMGYLHDDVLWECQECEHSWASGVPVGSSDEWADDLWCDSCDDSWMLVHRVQPRGTDTITLHLKCPNEECYYFTKTQRDLDDASRALVGYPQITGETEGAEPYGWTHLPSEQE